MTGRLVPTVIDTLKDVDFHAEELRPEDFPNAWAANDCSISLPLFHGLTDKEQQFVINNIHDLKF